MTVDELYSQLLNFETRMDLVQGGDQSSANMAVRGGCRGNNRGRGRPYRGRGRGPTNGGVMVAAKGATSKMVAPTTRSRTNRSIRCASRRGTLQLSVGTASMKTSSLKKSMQQRQPVHTTSTPTGTPTAAPLITSPAS